MAALTAVNLPSSCLSTLPTLAIIPGGLRQLLALPLLLPLLLLAVSAPLSAVGRRCPLAELEGIRRDCFYDFEAELAVTPPLSFHVLMEQKCNDSMLTRHPIMSDCVRSRVETHGCSNSAGLLHRFKLVELAHKHLCSARLTGEYCRELPKNLPHYVNLCIEALFDGITQNSMCSRSQMTVQKSQSCVRYILSLMGSACYYLQFNFFHIRNYAEGLLETGCSEPGRDGTQLTSSAAARLSAVAGAAVAAAFARLLLT